MTPPPSLTDKLELIDISKAVTKLVCEKSLPPPVKLR